MRLHDDRYECALCGAVLDIPLTAMPRVMLTARGGERTVRVLSVDGREVHRCVIDRSVRADASS